MDLRLLLLVLLAGGLAGWVARRRTTLIHWVRIATRLALGLLLAFMGAKLALNRDLFARDWTLFLWAVGSAAFLVLFYFGIFLLVGWRRRVAEAPVSLEPPAEAGESGGAHELLAVGANCAWILGGFLLLLVLPTSAARALPVDAGAEWLLRGLLLLIGFDLGAELHRLELRKLTLLLLLVPAANLLLTLGAGALFGLLGRQSVREGMLIFSGMGWYSLSSVLIAERGLVVLSLLAFIHNVFRELFSILTAPAAARRSPYLPVFLGGATSMDVMLPFVQRYCGREYTLVSFYSGVVCSLAVIPLVRLLLP